MSPRRPTRATHTLGEVDTKPKQELRVGFCIHFDSYPNAREHLGG